MTKTTTSRQPATRSNTIKKTVLRVLADNFCLPVKDIAREVRGREPNDNDKRSLRATLSLLLAQKLVCRLSYTDEDREYGSPSKVYGLTDSGVQKARDLGYDTEVTKRFDEHSAGTLYHELEISYLQICLRRFAKSRGFIVTFYRRGLKRGSVHPDLLFSLKDPKLPEAQNTWFFFVEVERAKFSKYKDGMPSIVPKLGDFFDLYNTDRAQKDWGFRKFRVIVIQRTPEKRQTLLRHLSEQYAHGMFWLTTEDLYKQDIGGEIFLTPKDHAQRSYSFLNL